MSRTAILSTGLCAAAILFACAEDVGPFFTPQKFPEDQTAFNHGRLGLLTPDLTKENELIAFRLLSGLKIPDNFNNGRAHRSSAIVNAADVRATGQEAWQQARRTVPDPANQSFFTPYRISHLSKPAFVFYLNCLDDAFETAARTLNDRRQQYPSKPAFKDWVVAQDQVFANCGNDKPGYPASAAADAPPLVKQDRDYQIAAAHFYGEDLPGAEHRFRAISADTKSPWQHIAGYMIGRTLLREVSLQQNTAAAPLARKQLDQVANDPSAQTLADSARGLVQHLDAIEHADKTLQTVAKQLLLPPAPQNNFADALKQSTYILTAKSFSQALTQPDVPEPFDWLQILKQRNAAKSLEKWRSNSSLPWLTLALMYASGTDQPAAELIEQADRLPTNSPASQTATYNAIRLRIERGETDQPRKKLDELLANVADQPESLVNGWRAERMRLATSFDDLLRWAPRNPIDAADYSGDVSTASSPILASDSAYFLNYKTPLSKLAIAAHSSRLPAWSASDLALATWTRAFMLNNSAVTADLAPAVSKTHADWASTITPGDAAQSDAWRFRAALTIALHHEFQPLISVDYRKHMDAGSWWCAVSEPKGQTPDASEGSVSWRLPTMFTPPDSVITPAERTTATEELTKLNQLGSAQSFLAPIIFNWAKEHPDDPLVPQALHRLVVVIRYGCHDEGEANAKISKTAFDLLHKRYPKSEWTAKTPYWFN